MKELDNLRKGIQMLKIQLDNVPEEEPTVPKHDVSYAEYTEHRKCEYCNMFMKEEEKCTIVEGKIVDNGVCYFWSFRNTKPPKSLKPKNMYTQEAAGYDIVPDGTHCGTCKAYVDPRMCKMVRGDIDPEEGCCALWH